MANKYVYLVAFIIACEMAGIIGSFFTAESVSTWYLTLEKPSFNPPSWVFAPVWTTLYALMGISAYLVFVSGKKESRFALIVFALQLALNTLWSLAFFGLQSPLYGLIVIIALWIAIVWTIIKFYPISRNAAYLLVPYILWISFASILNYSIWALL